MKSRKWSAHDMIDTSAMHATDADCQTQDGSAHGHVFMTFKLFKLFFFLTNQTINRLKTAVNFFFILLFHWPMILLCLGVPFKFWECLSSLPGWCQRQWAACLHRLIHTDSCFCQHTLLAGSSGPFAGFPSCCADDPPWWLGKRCGHHCLWCTQGLDHPCTDPQDGKAAGCRARCMWREVSHQWWHGWRPSCPGHRPIWRKGSLLWCGVVTRGGSRLCQRSKVCVAWSSCPCPSGSCRDGRSLRGKRKIELVGA